MSNHSRFTLTLGVGSQLSAINFSNLFYFADNWWEGCQRKLVLYNMPEIKQEIFHTITPTIDYPRHSLR